MIPSIIDPVAMYYDNNKALQKQKKKKNQGLIND
jgi:hypothetical protein